MHVRHSASCIKVRFAFLPVRSSTRSQQGIGFALKIAANI